HLDAMEALARIYRQRGDWGKTVRLLADAAEASKSPSATANYFHEAAQIHLQELDDDAGAESLLHRALHADPDHATTARAYAKLLFARGAYQELLPVLEVVRRKTNADDHEGLIALHHQMGAVAAKLGDKDAAKKYLEKVLDLAPDHAPTLTVLADLALEEEAWPRAHQALRRLHSLGAWPEGTQGDARYMQLADCEVTLGNKAQAIALVSELLERRPAHSQALERLAELKADSSDWTAVLQAKKALLSRTSVDDDWCRIQMEVGDILYRELGRADEAALAYRAGLERRADDRGLLHRLLDLHSAEKGWKETISVCQTLASIETEPANKAKYLGTAARIFGRELDQPDEALRFYNLALDTNPKELKAFEAVDKICTRRRDWKGLEQNYGRMLQRLPKDGDLGLKVMLWHNLGEVMRSRRRDFEGAMAAFEVAQKLEPSPKRAQILAELYLNSGPKYLDRAIGAHHLLLDSNPHRVSFYKALRRLYMESGRYDEAWGFCATLSFMQKADPEEEAFFRQYQRRSPPQAKARLMEDALQRHLYHPTLDPFLSAALALMAPAVAVRTARPHSDFKLKRKEHVDPATVDHPCCRIFAYASAVFNAPQVDFFLRPQVPASLQIAHTTEATSFVAGAHALAEGRDERQLAFIAGCQLSFLLPSLFLRVALPSRSELSIAFIAGLKFVNPNVNIPAEHRRPINKVHDQLRRRLRPHQLDQLKDLMSRLASRQKVDLDGWWKGAELTADRAGLLLCGDLETATRVVGMEPSSGGIPVRERASELVRFSTSQSYFILRRQMGLTIEGE
ncbi:MAG: tetratricopeptide repeat protein, partial [Deltaproteobacteria bacterium]|nr:tetratricopeptide repeat protein [Deltaproteobacteria bacterium]